MDELERAVDALSTLVRGGFGPSADETLLFAPPDVPVVSADGRALLASWRRGLRESCVDAAHSAPMQTFILDAAEGLSLLTGDGASEFVLLLHSAVKRTLDVVRDTRHAGMTLRQLAAAFGDVKRECAELLHDSDAWCPGLRVETSVCFDRASDGAPLTPSNELHAATVHVLESGLAGLLGAQALAFLIQLVLEWLFTPALVAPQQQDAPVISDDDGHCVGAAQLHARAQRFLAHANDAVVFTLAPSLFGSRVVPPGDFILRKSVVPTQHASIAALLPSTARPGIRGTGAHAVASLRFVCLTCELSLTAGANAVTVRTHTSAELFAAAAAPRAFATAFITALRKTHGVRLIVTTEGVDDAVVATCSRLGVACVQFAERSDVLALCAAARVQPLASVLDSAIERHVGACRGGVSSVRLQQSACLWFHGLDAAASEQCSDGDGDVGDGCSSSRARCDASNGIVPQLLLHAPTRGVFKQYAKAVVKALRILRSWWEPPTLRSSNSSDPQALVSCRGGGATELALATWLANAANSNIRGNGGSVSAALQLARRIVADALQDVVVVLHRNLSSALAEPAPLSQSGATTTTPAADPSIRAATRAVLQDRSRLHITAGTVTTDGPANGADALRICGYVLDTNHTVETLLGAVRVPALHFGDPLPFGLLHPWRRMDVLVALTLETLEQLLRVDCVLCVRIHARVRRDGEDGGEDEDADVLCAP